MFVDHSDFIPQDYLPTFNSNVIELCLNRINDLSEQFILFNDDMFILRPMEQDEFFKNGLPCDMALMDAMCVSGTAPNYMANNMTIINNHFKRPKA